MSEVCFILRARPGLGHVVPGLAIAKALLEKNVPVSIVTYENAVEFAGEIVGKKRVFGLCKDNAYCDYPGLELYDDGFRKIEPLLKARGARHLVLGGEYVLGFAAPYIAQHSAMIFNPEVFVDVPRNKALEQFFVGAFAGNDLMIPLQPAPSQPLMESSRALQSKFTACGPFRLQDVPATEGGEQSVHKRGRLIVIANGGGLAFPADTSSYSAKTQGGLEWVEHTIAMTIAAVRTLLNRLDDNDEVLIFTALTDAFSAQLDEAIAGDVRFTYLAPCARYFSAIRNADLFITRAGAGAVSDASDLRAACIFWPLVGHEEQAANADEAARTQGRWKASTPAEMEKVVRYVLDAAPPAFEPPDPVYRARMVADELIHRWGLVT